MGIALRGWIDIATRNGLQIEDGHECGVHGCLELGVFALEPVKFGEPEYFCKAHADALAAAGVQDHRSRP